MLLKQSNKEEYFWDYMNEFDGLVQKASV
jgi:hypothetical protein